MNCMKIRVSLLVAGTAALLAGPASAETVTITLRAQVATLFDPSARLGGSLQVGDIVSARYTYDPNVPDSDPDARIGSYLGVGAPFAFRVDAGALSFESAPVAQLSFLTLDELGDPPADSYRIHSLENQPLPNGTSVTTLTWQLTDPTGAALAGDQLPVSAPVLSQWQSPSTLAIAGGTFPERFAITAHVLSAELAPLLLVSPPSGTYVASQAADLVIIVGPGVAIQNGTITLDGVDASEGFAQCVRVGTLLAGGQSFRCPGLRMGYLGAGEHTVAVTLQLADGSTLNASALWKVLANTEP